MQNELTNTTEAMEAVGIDTTELEISAAGLLHHRCEQCLRLAKQYLRSRQALQEMIRSREEALDRNDPRSIERFDDAVREAMELLDRDGDIFVDHRRAAREQSG